MKTMMKQALPKKEDLESEKDDLKKHVKIFWLIEKTTHNFLKIKG